MSAELAQLVTTLAEDGLQINIWPTERGYQANVKERASKAWTCTSDPDPLAALLVALRQRAARVCDRTVTGPDDAEEQIDIEDAIAAVDHGELTGTCDCDAGYSNSHDHARSCPSYRAPAVDDTLAGFGL